MPSLPRETCAAEIRMHPRLTTAVNGVSSIPDTQVWIIFNIFFLIW